MRSLYEKEKNPGTENLLPHRLIIVALFLFVLATPIKSQQGWVSKKVVAPGLDLTSVYFLDDKRGWVGGDNGFLSRTDDGGRSWARQVVDTTDGINDIYFRDKEAGFLIAGNAIFGTRDNGTRWTEVRRFQPPRKVTLWTRRVRS